MRKKAIVVLLLVICVGFFKLEDLKKIEIGKISEISIAHFEKRQFLVSQQMPQPIIVKEVRVYGFHKYYFMYSVGESQTISCEQDVAFLLGAFTEEEKELIRAFLNKLRRIINRYNS